MDFPSSPQKKTRQAFTLIELLISLALSAILILGVNFMFKMSADTVGSGQALLTAMRGHRTAYTRFYDDCAKASATAPLFIRSQRQWAYRNKTDPLSDNDANVTTLDLNGDNDETDAGETLFTTDTNHRSHRLDSFGFFAVGSFARQTGNEAPAPTGTMVANMKTNEAFIWYGHLRLPDFSMPLGTAEGFEYRDPGEVPATGKNELNLHASDFRLGRVAMLLKPQAAGVINDDTTPTPIAQNFITRPLVGAGNYDDSLAPLTEDAPSDSGTAYENQWHRYDLGATTISEMTALVPAYTTDLTGSEPPWWEAIGGFRYQANPFPVRPINAANSAAAVPVFVESCSQFIVEYAGDYLAQDATTGAVLAGPPDGVTDFVIVPISGSGDPLRRTRWYGMPRNVDTSDDVGGTMIVGAASDPNDLIDVVPLRDVLATAGVTPTYGLFEHFGPTFPAPQSNYAGALPADAVYYAAWAAGSHGAVDAPRPQMIRVTMAIDNVNGRLADAQWFEYVIDLP